MPTSADVCPSPVTERRAARLRWGGVGAFVVAYSLWLTFGSGLACFPAVASGFTILGPLLAVALCAPAAFGAPAGRGRRSAGFLLAASTSFALGQVAWLIQESWFGLPVPLPSWTDAFNLVAYACLLAGMLTLPWWAAAAAERGRSLLDALASTAAAAAFSWYFVISPTLAEVHPSAAARALAILYPLLDLTILGLNLILAGGGRRRGVTGGALYALLLPSPIVTAASVIFYVQRAQSTYSVGGVIELSWPTANMLLAVAAWHLCRSAAAAARGDLASDGADNAARDVRTPRLTTFLPYALVVPTVGLAIYASRVDFWNTAAVGTRMAAVAVVGLLLLRQVLALAENERLYARLRRAFDDLEASHDAAHDVNDALAVANAQLAEANERLRSLATTDGMTGLPNHRAFQERLREEVARSSRTGEAFAVLLIDVDHFKQLNDAFGHPAGDEVLKTVAALLRSAVRASDLPARYGGEEFAVVCPNATAEQAVETGERIRRAIAGHAFEPRRVTVSVGVSGTDVAGLDAGGLIRSADEALYRSKRSGRDRVTAALVACGSATGHHPAGQGVPA